jgi:uncharacterized damage-inducible protein DinB
MSNKAIQLAEKLRSEGDKTLAFYQSLPDGAWDKQVFGDGAMWTVRGVFEHLCISEHTLRRLFEEIVNGGTGAPEGFDINAYNQSKTGRFGALPREEMFNLYRETRAKTIEFTQGLTDEQLALRGRHPAMGDTSLEEQIKMIYLHHTMHARDVKRVVGG